MGSGAWAGFQHGRKLESGNSKSASFSVKFSIEGNQELAGEQPRGMTLR